MLLHVLHETRYRYRPVVENAHHMAHLKPAHIQGQSLLEHTLQVEPKPVRQYESVDVYGNTRSYFSLHSAHDRLKVVANSLVLTAAPPPLSLAALTMPWDQVQNQFRYRAAAAYDSAAEFLAASPYVPRHAAFVDFAAPSFSPGKPLPEAAQDLMQRLYQHMDYESESTEINTPALQALRQGKGVCQDFTHILMACLRAMGLPARYVSGYLLTMPPPGQPGLVGSDASHAWASVYCPGAIGQPGQWLDLDATNNRAPGEDYVRLAVGRDFLDVSPLRGVIRGGAHHVLDVAVTVEPVTSLAT